MMKSSTTPHRTLCLTIAVLLLLENVHSLAFGGFNLNFMSPKPKVSDVEACKEFLSLKGVQVQSVSTGTFVDCEKILQFKSKAPTLFLVRQ